MQLLKALAGELTLWIAVLGLLTTLTVAVLMRIRAKTLQQEQALSELMSKFRELRSQGVLSDAEFRTIKSRLAARLGDEVKDNGGIG